MSTGLAPERAGAGLSGPGGTRVPPGPAQARSGQQRGDACVVCHRGEAPVCERCRGRTAEQLAALPELRARLRVALVPGPGTGERVTSPRGEAPMPARLAALTLDAGGSDDARCLFVPAVRLWTTVEHVPADPGGGPDRSVLHWHREPLFDAQGRPVMVLVDDQTGVLPLRAWLRAWALDWRHALGHSTAERAASRARRCNSQVVQPATPGMPALLGIGPARPPTERPDDPVAQEWHARWPSDAAGWGPATRRHHAYLAGWLAEACDRHPHIGDFAASLRTLTGAVRAALGDVQDLEYLGRCPEEIRDRATGATGPCGAPLEHDPYASVITCPRCRAETGQKRRIWLARRILDTWPIDRRRRYPRGLIDVLRKPTCATCRKPITVEWVDATERADRERFWRPGTVSCPVGCEVTL